VESYSVIWTVLFDVDVWLDWDWIEMLNF